MSPVAPTFRSSTLAGLGRAYRRWTATLVWAGPTPAIDGATESDRVRLAALGGVAAQIAGGVSPEWDPEVRRWMSQAPDPPSDIVNATIEALGRGEDALGALYTASIGAPQRRRLGTVFTPQPLVEYMLDLADAELPEPPSIVVDPGAGVGAFTVAAAKAWPDAQIIASDVNVVTLGLLTARLAFEDGPNSDPATPMGSIDLRLGDYLDEFPRLMAGQPDGPVLVLGNPPYTRIQELTPEARLKAAGLAGDLLDSGHANLAMLFQAATIRLMRPQDVSCLVVPGSFAYTRASRALRHALWTSRRSLSVYRTPAESKVFTGRSVQAAILTVGPEHPTADGLHLGRVQFDDSSVEVLETWSLDRRMLPPDNWFWTDAAEVEDGGTRLGEVAVVRRGTATGANRMFFLTDEVRSKLPAHATTPGILNLRDVTGDRLTPEQHLTFGNASTPRWLLAVPPEMELSGALARYVAAFRDTVSQRHLPSQRRPWWSITELPRPQILISPLATARFRVVLNEAAAVPSNSLFGITLRDPQADPEPLASWLRSSQGQTELFRVSHRYPGGSHKVEPRRLCDVRLPPSIVRGSLATADEAGDGD